MPEAASSTTSFHHLDTDAALAQLEGSIHGLSQQETAARRERYGRNALPKTRPPPPCNSWSRPTPG
jgi:hypothetical protein